VFDRNPLTTAPDAFAEASIVLTMFHGEVVVDRRAVLAAFTS
jgi:predicted amidohydrolase YtcJ